MNRSDYVSKCLFIAIHQAGFCPWVMVSRTMLWIKLISIKNLMCITKTLYEISANFYFQIDFLKIYLLF